jgi:hypothetical protein
MLRQLHVAIGPSISNWVEKYRDDRNLTGIVLAIFLEAIQGEPVAFEAGELMASFVSLNGDLALRDTRTIDGVAKSRRASISGGVVNHGYVNHLLVS